MAPGSTEGSNNSIADLDEDTPPVSAFRGHPFVLDQGHRFDDAVRGLRFEARELDQTYTQESTPAYTVTLSNAFHVSIKCDEDCFVDVSNGANQLVRGTPRKGFVQKRDLVTRRNKSMAYGIGDAFVEE